MKLSWLGLSLISLVSFGFMGFLVTMMTRRGYSVPVLLSGVSLVVIIVYLTQVFRMKEFHVFSNPSLIGMLVFLGVLSAIGNWTQFQAMHDAPNPGLALAITNLFTIPTTLLAVFVLKDKLTLVQIIGIGICIIGASLLSLGNLSIKTNN